MRTYANRKTRKVIVVILTKRVIWEKTSRGLYCGLFAGCVCPRSHGKWPQAGRHIRAIYMDRAIQGPGYVSLTRLLAYERAWIRGMGDAADQPLPPVMQ
jgi:hypothetical protein